METQLLRDPQVSPSGEVLKNALGESYPAFEELIQNVTGNFGLELIWNYYKDGKAWLCKVCHRKKTIFWLSVWDGCFKTAFYFTEKHRSAIEALDIEEKIKEEFNHRKPIGKLIPLVLNISRREQLADLLRIAQFKINWKG